MAHKTSVKIARNPAAKAKAIQKRGDKESPLSKRKSSKRTQKAFIAKTGFKKDRVLALLRRKAGANIDELAKATGWQAHSVRGFLSGTIKNKLGLTLSAEKVPNGERRYFLKGAK